MKVNFNASFSFLILFFIYTFAFGLGQAILFYIPSYIHPLEALAIAMFSSTLFIYLFSTAFNNSSVFDPFWSLAPIVYLFYFFKISDKEIDSFRHILVLIAVMSWGIRLTLNWARGWKGLKHEDWRFVKLKQAPKWKAFLSIFFGVHLFQTLQILLGMLPLYPAITEFGGETNGLDILALAISLTGVVISLIADEQLKIFKKKNKDPQAFIQSGLWRLSRHPNYFGECIYWVGIFFIGFNANPDYWWTCIGSISMYLMFRLISIPMMEKRLLETRPEYEAYKRETPPFMPIKIPYNIKALE